VTVETSYLFGPEDIISLVFVCTKCGSKMSIPAASIKRKPVLCHHCEEQWISDVKWKDEVIDDFVRTLGKLKAVLEDRPFSMKLEVASLGQPR
jgi:DNA-directed RNA polymerase subunit RPC12/RpoP